MAVLLAAASCASGSRVGAGEEGGGAGAVPRAAAGPYAVGVRTVRLPDTVAEVWYPVGGGAAGGAGGAGTAGASGGGAAAASGGGAVGGRATYDIRDWLPPETAKGVTPGRFTLATDAYRDLPVAGHGPYPLVLFAHGLYSFPDQSTGLTTWLASWGYVVAAPDLPVHDLAAYFRYTARGLPLPTGPSDEQVLAQTEQFMRAQASTPGSPFWGRVARGPVGVVGHSQGGIDAMAFSSSGTSGSADRVATYIALAAGFTGAHPPLPAVPSLYMAGALDHDIPPPLVESVYAAAPQPKRLVVLPAAGHLAFTDLCLINPGHGGLGAIAPQIGMTLSRGAPFTAAALDGCGPGFAPPTDSLARVRAAVLAQLRAWLPAPAT
ncbi:MAG TPA: dienelactone hydrolase family protein [Acidimicrobiales bacterium]|nr:dienelactone hydrolase family protein [Acidimicrobiales bacterium]